MKLKYDIDIEIQNVHYSKFDHLVCDNCRDMGKDGEHELITKTEAKSTFILKLVFIHF